jgi:hypothetical protein
MRKKGMFESFVKHELKGVLKYREQKIAFTSPPPPQTRIDIAAKSNSTVEIF